MFVIEGQSSDVNTAVGFEIVLNYVDGTQSEPYKQSMFSLLRLHSLVDMSGKEIASFGIRLKSTLKTSEVVTSWQLVGSQQIEIYKSTDPIPKTSSSVPFGISGASWVDGAEKEVMYTTLHWSQVEAAIESYGEGTWSIQINGAISITVDFNDGSEDLATANASASMPFSYSSSGITQFSMVVNNGVTSMSLSNQLESVGIPTWTLYAVLPICALVFTCLAVLSYKSED